MGTTESIQFTHHPDCEDRLQAETAAAEARKQGMSGTPSRYSAPYDHC